MTSQSLLALFTPYGTVMGGEVKTNEDGSNKGFGFIIMSTEEEATKAMDMLNGTKQGEEIITVKLSNPKKGEKGDGKGKGKDKGKDDKGKGKGKGKKKGGPSEIDAFASPYQQPYGMSPYDPYGGADPIQMMQMQQMYMMQMQAMYAAQMQMAMPPEMPSGPAGKGKGKKGKGKGRGKDSGTKVEGTFIGRLKSINTKDEKGYGFIECAETMATYNRDVFITSDLVPEGAKVGDPFKFNVTLNDKGHPRATNVVSVP